MKAPHRQIFAKLSLIAGLAAHLLFPMAIAAAPATFDVASLICAPSGKVSAEANAALAELLRLAGEDAPGEPDNGAAKHCSGCVLAACAPSHTPAAALAIVYAGETRLAPAGRDNAHSTVHGPPLGLRAPPHPLSQ